MRAGRGFARVGLALVAAGGCGGAGATAAPVAPGVVRLRPTAAAARAEAARLAPLVTACWGLPAVVDAPEAWPAAGAEATRDARALLTALAPRRPADAAALVWIGDDALREAADPASRPVFGLGEARDRLAVVSLRLLGPDGAAAPWAARRARVGLHEAGHALGLAHCDDPWCLMHDSDDLRELDATGLAPCATCWRRYAGVRGHDPAALRAALVTAAAGLGLGVAPPEAHELDFDRSPGGTPAGSPPWSEDRR